jgi:hypothetical protein
MWVAGRRERKKASECEEDLMAIKETTRREEKIDNKKRLCLVGLQTKEAHSGVKIKKFLYIFSCVDDWKDCCCFVFD